MNNDPANSAEKTSTFTLHHSRCNPEKWTARDIIAFADFVRTGDLWYASHLSRLGVQLVLSEHHVPAGGTLERVGWATEGDPQTIYDDLGEAVDAGGDNDVTPLWPVYRGPMEYVARYLIGDEEGNVDGREYEVKATEPEAEAFIASLSS